MPISGGGGGGGSQPLLGLLQGVCTGNHATVQNDTFTHLNFDNPSEDFDLIFDRSVLNNPVTRADGLYIFSVEGNTETGAAAGVFNLSFYVDNDGSFGDGPHFITPNNTADDGSVTHMAQSMPMARYLTAGMSVVASAYQNSGAPMADVWWWVHVVFIPFTRST